MGRAIGLCRNVISNLRLINLTDAIRAASVEAPQFIATSLVSQLTNLGSVVGKRGTSLNVVPIPETIKHRCFYRKKNQSILESIVQYRMTPSIYDRPNSLALVCSPHRSQD